jgi:glycerol transport system substrate-binding protein
VDQSGSRPEGLHRHQLHDRTDKKLYQLPDQQFANLYWFRADLFARQDLKDKFKAKYGYDLGVPLNWSAYEDIAAFFSEDVKTIDGKPIYGHMDYGKKDPSLGWRFTDAWLSMAGTADIGIPNGKPVDEWGIRPRPTAAPARRLGLARRRDQLAGRGLRADQVRRLDEEVRAEGSDRHDLRRGRPGAGAGPDRAADLLVHRVHRRHDEGRACRSSMPTARRSGAWRPDRTARTGSRACRTATRTSARGRSSPRTTRTDRGGLAVRAVRHREDDVAEEDDRRPDPDPRVRHPVEGDDRHGAEARRLVEFYRSPARVAWTPTGTNVPDYPKLAQLWWKNVAVAVTGEKTPQAAMDTLAEEMDQVMARLERAGMAHCPPKLNPKGDPNKYLSDKGAPWKKLANEKPKGETIAYEKLLSAWKEGKVR